MISDPTDRANADFDAMLRLGVQKSLATSDFVPAFAGFYQEMPRTAPGFAAQIPPEAGRSIAMALFREIWNHTPRPDQGWKRLPLPKPERNGPCPCGSGAKYKQCCGPMEGASPFPAGGFSVLCYVLETIPVTQFASLPFKKFDAEEVAHAASEWQKDGRIGPATLLLEALLAPGTKLGRQHEYAFDTLCDLYLDADRADDRLALVERVMQSPDPHLRAAAWQRRATLHADCGEHAEAWQTFKEAQRIDPDNPALAHLELSLLASQDRYDEVATRAAFWAKRLVKLGYQGEPIVGLMEDIARDPETLRALLAQHVGGEPVEAAPQDLAALESLIEELPAAACHYRLSPQDGSAGPLRASAELAAVEQQWQHAFWDEAEQRDPWLDTRWVDWLRAHPLAWQSFAVIDDVLGILEDGLFSESDDDRIEWMEETLLDRAVALLRLVLAENAAEGLKLEWGWMENRPALRMVMDLLELARGSAEELPLLEWLVLTLNPDDNGGHRERLVHAYCDAGRPAEALAVCDRYADDGLPGTLYGRVLALYLLERRGDAAAALADAKKKLPKVLKTLLAARPKAPANLDGMSTHGSDDQAWNYRMNSCETWEKCNALTWLKEVSGGKA
jgi:tetratricopeptide (TPR) repeat protein